MNEFTILITTYNRKNELNNTLLSLRLFMVTGVPVIVCDDGSSDGTSELIRKSFPEIHLISNEENLGLIYSRNRLLNLVTTSYAISLDDDANFLSEAPLGKMANYFEAHPRCAVISFRIYWGLECPKEKETSDGPEVVKSFVGCGHAWRMQAWKEIPDYPSWYRFYGEENFASSQLFKTCREVHYLPTILVHHRVDNKARKKNKDYYLRARKSLRADWFNYFIFYPKSQLVRLFLYTIKAQLLKAKKTRDMKVVKNLFLALGDIVVNSRRLKKNRNSLTSSEYSEWKKLPNARIYWKKE